MRHLRLVAVVAAVRAGWAATKAVRGPEVRVIHGLRGGVLEGVPEGQHQVAVARRDLQVGLEVRDEAPGPRQHLEGHELRVVLREAAAVLARVEAVLAGLHHLVQGRLELAPFGVTPEVDLPALAPLRAEHLAVLQRPAVVLGAVRLPALRWLLQWLAHRAADLAAGDRALEAQVLRSVARRLRAWPLAHEAGAVLNHLGTPPLLRRLVFVAHEREPIHPGVAGLLRLRGVQRARARDARHERAVLALAGLQQRQGRLAVAGGLLPLAFHVHVHVDLRLRHAGAVGRRVAAEVAVAAAPLAFLVQPAALLTLVAIVGVVQRVHLMGGRRCAVAVQRAGDVELEAGRRGRESRAGRACLGHRACDVAAQVLEVAAPGLLLAHPVVGVA
mmetsp:Transcript_79989/g.205792  ORF Transcript_79989/g.205792 Transcript_79989/m.205792 type:complete len:387 (+) Transcript_79989:796-1956(+)